MTGPAGRDKHEGEVFCFAASSTTVSPAQRNWLTFTVIIVFVMHREGGTVFSCKAVLAL